jgi:hypothetical protein
MSSFTKIARKEKLFGSPPPPPARKAAKKAARLDVKREAPKPRAPFSQCVVLKDLMADKPTPVVARRLIGLPTCQALVVWQPQPGAPKTASMPKVLSNASVDRSSPAYWNRNAVLLSASILRTCVELRKLQEKDQKTSPVLSRYTNKLSELRTALCQKGIAQAEFFKLQRQIYDEALKPLHGAVHGFSGSTKVKSAAATDALDHAISAIFDTSFLYLQRIRDQKWPVDVDKLKQQRAPAITQICNFFEVSPHLARGGQPDALGFQWLEARGYKTFVNLRAEHKDTFSAAIASKVNVIDLPMPDGGVPTTEQVDKFLALFEPAAESPSKVFMHCWAGAGRTGTMVAIYESVMLGRNVEDALKNAACFTFSGEFSKEQSEFVRDYVAAALAKKKAS